MALLEGEVNNKTAPLLQTIVKLTVITKWHPRGIHAVQRDAIAKRPLPRSLEERPRFCVKTACPLRGPLLRDAPHGVLINP